MPLEKPRGLLSNILPALGICPKISTTVQRVQKRRERDREKEIRPKILTLSQRHILQQSMWCLDVVWRWLAVLLYWNSLGSACFCGPRKNVVGVTRHIVSNGQHSGGGEERERERKKKQWHTWPRNETKLGRSRITKLHGNDFSRARPKMPRSLQVFRWITSLSSEHCKKNSCKTRLFLFLFFSQKQTAWKSGWNELKWTADKDQTVLIRSACFSAVPKVSFKYVR